MGGFQCLRNKVGLKELTESTRKDLVYYVVMKMKLLFEKENNDDLWHDDLGELNVQRNEVLEV